MNHFCAPACPSCYRSYRRMSAIAWGLISVATALAAVALVTESRLVAVVGLVVLATAWLARRRARRWQAEVRAAEASRPGRPRRGCAL